MTPKLKAIASPVTPDEAIDWKTAPATNKEHVHRIRLLGKRISEYIGYMCKFHDQLNLSSESKRRTLEHFYQRMVLVEHELARIHEASRLE